MSNVSTPGYNKKCTRTLTARALIWNVSVPCLYTWVNLEKILTTCYSLVISLLLVSEEGNNNDIVFFHFYFSRNQRKIQSLREQAVFIILMKNNEHLSKCTRQAVMIFTVVYGLYKAILWIFFHRYFLRRWNKKVTTWKVWIPVIALWPLNK